MVFSGRLPRLRPRSERWPGARADRGGRPGQGEGAARRRSLWPIVLAGLCLELLLVLSFVPAPLVPLTADSGMDELLPWLALLGQPIHERLARLNPWIELMPLAVLLQMACFLGLFIPYGLALRALRGRSGVAIGRLVLLFGVLFEVTALGSRRMFSTDLFSYILNGRILLFHGGNPYVDVPAQFPEDPYLPLVVWREVPNHYGPLWTFVSAGVAWLGGEQVGWTLFLFRLIAAAAAVAAAILIWRLLRRERPDQAALGAALWAWNPLVVLEGAGSGHNDTVLALLLVLAASALTWRRTILGLLALATAVLVKYSAAVLGLLYLAVLLRRADPRRVVLGIVIAGSLAAAAFLPFRASVSAPSVYVSSMARYLNSPAELLFQQIRSWLGDDSRLVVERIEFHPWWARVNRPTDLFLERSGRIPIGQVAEGRAVLATNRSDGLWQRVYDPLRRDAGYVRLSSLRATNRPSDLPDDPELARYQGPATHRIGEPINLAIRVGGWLMVLAAMAALFRSAATPDHLLRGWLALLVLVYLLVATWFFPWYLIWGLAVAALRPRGPLTWALVVWSAAVLLYYGVAPFEWDAQLGWLYRWRAVPMFLPPLLVIGWHLAARRGARAGERARSPAAERPALAFLKAKS